MAQLRLTPWRDDEEFLSVCRALFDTDGIDAAESARRRSTALDAIAAWQSRQRVPQSVICTAQLVTARDLDLRSANDSSAAAISAVQLAYSMAIVRFVNTLLDPLQKHKTARPLNALAKQLQLPAVFVELRHAATHENLPSLQKLRSACQSAIDWLFERYWQTCEFEWQFPSIDPINTSNRTYMGNTKTASIGAARISVGRTDVPLLSNAADVLPARLDALLSMPTRSQSSLLLQSLQDCRAALIADPQAGIVAIALKFEDIPCWKSDQILRPTVDWTESLISPSAGHIKNESLRWTSRLQVLLWFLDQLGQHEVPAEIITQLSQRALLHGSQSAAQALALLTALLQQTAVTPAAIQKIDFQRAETLQMIKDETASLDPAMARYIHDALRHVSEQAEAQKQESKTRTEIEKFINMVKSCNLNVGFNIFNDIHTSTTGAMELPENDDTDGWLQWQRASIIPVDIARPLGFFRASKTT